MSAYSKHINLLTKIDICDVKMLLCWTFSCLEISERILFLGLMRQVMSSSGDYLNLLLLSTRFLFKTSF